MEGAINGEDIELIIKVNVNNDLMKVRVDIKVKNDRERKFGSFD